jgi:uncharacterized protein
MTMASSSAGVSTTRPERYGKQLAAHLGRKNGGSWSDAGRRGWVVFPSGRLELAEDVVTRHLLRFAVHDELEVHWTRAEADPVTRTP